MPLLTVQLGPQGPLLDLEVGVSAPRRKALEAAGQPVPPPVPVRALIDTGAQGTCVDKGVIAQLNLTPTGTVPIHTPSTVAGAPATCNQYDVFIRIPYPALSRIFNVVAVIESDLAAQGIHCLIGRDILASCLFVYNGETGFFTIAS